MRGKPHISSGLVIIFVLLLSTSPTAAAGSKPLTEISHAVFTTIDFVSNIETIGVAVRGTGVPSTVHLSYRRSGEAIWRSGHRLMRIDDGRLIGSLFDLSPATSYDIRVSDGSSEIIGSVRTQPDQLSFTPSVILHVDDNASPGGDGSTTAPFQKIQDAVNQAGPGTQVLVADGLYREAITFPNSGTAENWIQVKAAGNAAILDSAEYLFGSIWTSTSTAKVWFTKIGGPVAYLSRGGDRFYQYDDKTGLMQAKGHGGVTVHEGWYYEASTQRLYIRSLDNPANYMWRLPRLNHAFDIAARNWIWIEGFEIRFYGTTTNGCGVCALNASHIVIRNNKIHNMQLGIFINWSGGAHQGNDTRIEGNEVYDPLVNAWPWAAVKGSFMEGTGIIIRGHIGAIVRDNNVHNFFNGMYTGSSGALENSELAFDADIYHNTIHHISDDALEPEGACVNQRFRDNTVDRIFIGLSLAPVTQGPTWVLRSTFTNFTGRGIKFADDSDGIVLIYHNTGWTSAANINGADLITPIQHVVMRNNIFQSTGYSFAEVPTGSTANDWNHNNWYTTRGSTGPHFRWENVNFNTISALCSATGLECNGYESVPGFTDPTGGDFTLLSSSPNIDRGVVLPGINDNFAGSAPDVGAYEFISGYSISGNAGAGGVALSYVDGTSKTVISQADGGYSLQVPSAWSGTVTPSKSGYRFSPASRMYNHVTTSQAGQNYTATPLYTISGNGGVAEVTLSYIDGTQKTVTSQTEGSYSLLVPGGWSGTVTPTHPCFTFSPADHSYSNLGANEMAQDFVASFHVSAGCSDVGVEIGSRLQGRFGLPAGDSTRANFPGVNAGPVKIESTNAIPLIAAERLIYKVGGVNTSFSEMMALPDKQLDKVYWLPWYNNNGRDLDTQLRFANVSAEEAQVAVFIGDLTVPRATYTLQPGESRHESFAGVNDGPVKIVSNQKIVAAERLIYKAGGINTSFSEMMALPDTQLDSTYWLPWYNNNGRDLDTQLRFANVSAEEAQVAVFIGDLTVPRATYSLQPGESRRESFPGVNDGPVKIVSDQKIVAAERLIYKINNANTSFAEMMALPQKQVDKVYWLPWYNNNGKDLDTQLRFANTSDQTATVHIYIGGQEMGTGFTLQPGKSTRQSFTGINNGPVQIVSDQPIVVAERLIYKVNNSNTSFSEMMALPDNSLDTRYWLPWYDNIDIDAQLRFGVP
jgi:hypothetical protein